MKKFIKIITLTLSLLLFLFAFTGCFKRETVVDVQIKHSENTETVSFNTGAYASDIKVKPDYVEDKILLGYYDTQDDSGNMYFDFLGNFTMKAWLTSYPTKLYAVYDNVDAKTPYKSTVTRDENPYSTGYKYNNWTNWKYYNFSETSMNVVKREDKYTNTYANLAKFIYSNGNKKVRLTFHFSAKQICSDCSIKLDHRVKICEEVFDTNRVTLSQQWKDFSISVEVYAKQLKGSSTKEDYIYLQMNTYGNPHLADLYTVKNIYYTINVIE